LNIINKPLKEIEPVDPIISISIAEKLDNLEILDLSCSGIKTLAEKTFEGSKA